MPCLLEQPGRTSRRPMSVRQWPVAVHGHAGTASMSDSTDHLRSTGTVSAISQRQPRMHATTVAGDLAKSAFELAVADAQWRVVGAARWQRLAPRRRRIRVGTGCYESASDAGYATAGVSPTAPLPTGACIVVCPKRPVRKIRLRPICLIQRDLDPLRTKLSSPRAGSNGDFNVLRPQTPKCGSHARGAAKHDVPCYAVHRCVVGTASTKLVLSKPLNGQVQLRRNIRVCTKIFEVFLYFWIQQHFSHGLTPQLSRGAPRYPARRKRIMN